MRDCGLWHSTLGGIEFVAKRDNILLYMWMKGKLRQAQLLHCSLPQEGAEKAPPLKTTCLKVSTHLRTVLSRNVFLNKDP